jgi:hypothetical protein
MTYQLHHIDNRLHDIHVDTARGVDDIQNYATSRATNEAIEKYENTLMHRTSNLKSNINGQLDNLHHDIISRRPSPNDSDYEQRREQYRAFLVHANDGVGSMKGVFGQLFSKLFDVVKKIVHWILNRLPQILSAIAGIFTSVILPLLGVM